MRRSLTIEDYYQHRHHWIPDEIRMRLGHFNIFPLAPPAIGPGAEDLDYRRREWYNIVLVRGRGILQCSGEEYPVEKHAVAFTDPFTPFGWRRRDRIDSGYFCLFNEQFLGKDKRLVQFPPFRADTPPLYELNDAEATVLTALFVRMTDELRSDYIYKYDHVRLLTEEILHQTMKTENFDRRLLTDIQTGEGIVLQFLELLERQFPIENRSQTIQLRSASDFARQLNIHVNHLNRLVRRTTEKSTTQIIKERVLQEARTMIRLSAWNISEIAYTLGFKEPTHFNNFFKKSTGMTPTQYRKV